MNADEAICTIRINTRPVLLQEQSENRGVRRRAHSADPAISGIPHSCGGSWPHHPHFRHSGDRHAAHGAPLRRVRDGSPEDGAPLRNPGDGGSEDHAAQGIRSPGTPAPQASFAGGVSVAEGGKTMGLMQSQMGFDPVVGWLACVEGPSRGKSYTIRGGINSIGRGDRMDIVITGDLKISSETMRKSATARRTTASTSSPGRGATSSTSTMRRCSPPCRSTPTISSISARPS